MKTTVVPFLTAGADAVTHSGWTMVTVDGEVRLPAALDDWDYLSVLELTGAVAVDRDALLGDCGLAAGTELNVIVTAHSDHTQIEQLVAKAEVPDADRSDLSIRFSLPGARLGGKLTLRTVMAVAVPVPAGPLAPTQPGSVVWRTQHQTHLQGSAAQFPTDAIDFALSSPGNESAGWEFVLDVTDPEARFVSAARLSLNSGRKEMLELLAGDTGPAALRLQRMLRWDVTRRMATAGILSDDVALLEFDREATSVAGILRNLLATIWPDVSPASLRERMLNDPARIEVEIQSHCGLFP